MAEYKNVGNHVEDLADGRMYAPGETFDLDSDAVEDPFNKDKIDRGVLITTDEAKDAKRSSSEKKGTE